MRSFRDFPIRLKLQSLVLGIVGMALLLLTAATVLNEIRTTRSLMANQFSTLANVLAANSAAALSVDPGLTQAVLDDLVVEPAIVFACTFDVQGRVAARYASPAFQEFAPPPPGEDGYAFTSDGYLDVFRHARVADQPVGTVYLRATTQEVQAQIRRSITSLLCVLAGALCVAVFLSFALQRIISGPILQLVQAAQTVSAESDFSVRVAKRSQDELGTLCDAFNSMLAQIQERDGELVEHREHLEQLVADRTRQLGRTNAELARSNSELEQFAYIASHDLQEPLRKVQAFGDMLAGKYREALGAEGQDYLQRMQNAAARMKTLINDLLTYSRVTSKAQPFTEVDLAAVAREVATDLETRLRETGGQLEIGPLPRLEAEPTQMRQLLQNLIGNGLKYHAPDVPPVVQVESRMRDNTAGAVLASAASEQVCEIRVQDRGIGFEEKHADRIFSPFVRLHGRGEYEGTGMGLAVCRKIVERHGGTITALSSPGQGATFVVLLPAHQAKPTPSDE